MQWGNKCLVGVRQTNGGKEDAVGVTRVQWKCFPPVETVGQCFNNMRNEGTTKVGKGSGGACQVN